MNTTDPREGKPSASSMWRTAMCPGWLALSRDIPRKNTSDSESGTRTHAALAGEGVDLTAHEEMTRELCEEIETRIATEFGFNAEHSEREKRFWFGSGEFSGQADVVYKFNRLGLVIDFKTLHGRQQAAAENWQLRTLVVLVSDNWSLEWIMAAVVAPWLPGQHQLVEYGKEEIEQARVEIVEAVQRTQNPEAPRTPGEWCKFCPARGICVEANEQNKAVVLRAQTSLDVLTPKERGELLDWMDWATGVMSEKKAAIKAMIEADPASVEGWMLKDGRRLRTVTNAGAALTAIQASFGLTLDEFLSSCAVSTSKLEEFVYQDIKANGHKETRKQVKENVEVALGDLVEVKAAEKSLVKI